MASRILTLVVAALGLMARPLPAKEKPRISIPDLLNPATRVEAWRKFMIAAEPEAASRLDFAEADQFARLQVELRVQPLGRARQDPRYLVVWRANFSPETWTWEQLRRTLGAPGEDREANRLLFPQSMQLCRVFTANGESLPVPESGANRVIYGDFDGDGEPDLIDDAHVNGDGLEGEMLIVRRVAAGSKPSLAILFNSHKPEEALGNTWGFQARLEEGEGGSYAIDLGPARVGGGVTPEVSFRWNGVDGRWEGPAGGLDAHYRVLRGDPVAAVNQILREGGLGYAVSPAPPPLRSELPSPRMPRDLDAMPRDRLSKPYRYRSLQSLGDQALFDYFGRGKAATDFAREYRETATAVLDFWELPPRAAAVAYVAANQAPELRADRLIDIDEPLGPFAPKVGGLTLVARPYSNADTASSGAFGVYHLQCAREGSFLLYSEWLPGAGSRPLIERVTRVHFHRVDLPYAEALRLLQTAWWMSAVRTRKLSGQRDNYDVFFFERLQFELQFSLAGQGLSLAGDATAGFPGQYLGTGPFHRGAYQPADYARLVLQIFQREVPARLGAAWPGRELETFNPALAMTQPGEEIEAERGRAADVLKLFRGGQITAAAAVPAVMAAGEFSWSELRDEVAALKPLLPPLSAYEERLQKHEAELKRWRETLGKEANEYAYNQRVQRRSAASANLGNAPANLQPLTPEEKQKFDDYDRLVRIGPQVKGSGSAEELGAAALRQAIERALRQLEAGDDPERLQALAFEEPEAEAFAVARLAAVDRPRAVDLLKKLEERHAGSAAFERARESRFRLEERTQSPQARLGPACLLLRTGDTAPWELLRLSAFVAPPDDPARYADPLVDDALVRAVARTRPETAAVTRELAVAAARRLGECAWAPLLVRGGKGPIGMAKVLPGLAMVAAAHPESYRAELRKLLEDQVTACRGGTDYVIWAVWRSDLRELKKAVEELATGSPDDYDGPLGREASAFENSRPYRYHSARHIAALWNEEDALTRAKLALAFAVHHAGELQDDRGALALVSREVTNARAELDAAAAAELEKFRMYCAGRAEGRSEDIRLVAERLQAP